MHRNAAFRRSIRRTTLSPVLSTSHINRSASFNSSGRGSNCDMEEVCSDTSLEEDVNDLNNKVNSLQRKVCELTELHHQEDDRYSRSRQENGSLQVRLLQAEEQLRDQEQRAEQQLCEEKQKQRDTLHRLDREHKLQMDNVHLKLQCAEKELEFVRVELERQNVRCSQLEEQRSTLDHQLQEHEVKCQRAEQETAASSRRVQQLLEMLEQQQVSHRTAMLELTDRAEESSRRVHQQLTRNASVQEQCARLNEEVRQLRSDNASLQEKCDELHLQLLSNGVGEGRRLLGGDLCWSDCVDGGSERDTSACDPMPSLSLVSDKSRRSLADELKDDLIRIASQQPSEPSDDTQLRNALTEKTEENRELRAYIDGILLNIVEHHPELLEVRHKK